MNDIVDGLEDSSGLDHGSRLLHGLVDHAVQTGLGAGKRTGSLRCCDDTES